MTRDTIAADKDYERENEECRRFYNVMMMVEEYHGFSSVVVGSDKWLRLPPASDHDLEFSWTVFTRYIWIQKCKVSFQEERMMTPATKVSGIAYHRQ